MLSKCFHCTIKKIHHLFSSLRRKACPPISFEACVLDEKLTCGRVPTWYAALGSPEMRNMAVEGWNL